jgi:hypothetical protein
VPSQDLLRLLKCIVETKRFVSKGLTSDRKREVWYQKAERSYSDLLALLEQESLQAEINQLLEKLSVVIADPRTAEVTADVISNQRSDLIRSEFLYHPLTKLSEKDYNFLLKEAGWYLERSHFASVVTEVPKNVTELRAVFEGTIGCILGAGERVDFPRKAKRACKSTAKSTIAKTCLGAVMAVSNVVLALPQYGLSLPVSTASMAFGAAAIGFNLPRFPRILSKGMGREPGSGKARRAG